MDSSLRWKDKTFLHKYEAKIAWNRNGAKFTDVQYSRAHQWSFDGGITVPASSSPLAVKLPLSVAEAVDPEEALVASASSCHMLMFLYLAAKKGFVIDSYEDNAFGEMGKNSAAKAAITRITLRPDIKFTPEKIPSPAELDALHHQAHDECFIANTIKSEVVVAPA
ncbi:MAG: OsmC family protein [Candidatus Zixiibacteriota bacterium]